MTKVAYVNGRFVPQAEATVSVMDRGFLFGDGIYEVAAVVDGRMIDNDAHLARLDRSLGEIRITNPHSRTEWIALEEEIVRRNALAEGLVYVQVTRGAVPERDFAFPPADTEPSVVLFAQPKTILVAPSARTGIAVVTVDDLRWRRRDIKSVALLAQVLAKQAAAEAGVGEAWMVEDGFVTEGSSSTAFIITTDGAIVTRPLSQAILPGVTRRAVLSLAAEKGLAFDERPFSVAEALGAAEAFITSASSFVMPVVRIDGEVVGDGKPGPLTQRLRELYIAAARG